MTGFYAGIFLVHTTLLSDASVFYAFSFVFRCKIHTKLSHSHLIYWENTIKGNDFALKHKQFNNKYRKS